MKACSTGKPLYLSNLTLHCGTWSPWQPIGLGNNALHSSLNTGGLPQQQLAHNLFCHCHGHSISSATCFLLTGLKHKKGELTSTAALWPRQSHGHHRTPSAVQIRLESRFESKSYTSSDYIQRRLNIFLIVSINNILNQTHVYFLS